MLFHQAVNNFQQSKQNERVLLLNCKMVREFPVYPLFTEFFDFFIQDFKFFF